MRRCNLKDDDPLLVGRLVLINQGRRYEPVLGINVWCPCCKRDHNHGWGFERIDHVEHRVGHCGQTSRFWKGGYHVGLDPHPSLREEHRRLLAEYQKAVSDHLAFVEAAADKNAALAEA